MDGAVAEVAGEGRLGLVTLREGVLAGGALSPPVSLLVPLPILCPLLSWPPLLPLPRGNGGREGWRMDCAMGAHLLHARK